MNLFTFDDFSKWSSLNDTIMGGSSQAVCKKTSKGLLLKGKLVEEGGGFVSCRSPILSQPFNLSKYRGLQIEVEGEGRTLKISISCERSNIDLSRFIYPRLKWIAPLDTNKIGITNIKVPFAKFEPVVRAKPVLIPVQFNPSNIYQFQLLYSKFGRPGKFNPNFSPGDFKIILHSIKAYE